MGTTNRGDDRSPVYNIILDIPVQSALTGVFANIPNPHGQELLIHSAAVIIDTVSTGASTVDVGVGATATTASDTLIDGVSLATLGTVSAIGTNGGQRTWGASQFVTIGEASGDVAGFIGRLTVQYSIL